MLSISFLDIVWREFASKVILLQASCGTLVENRCYIQCIARQKRKHLQ